MSGRIKAFYRGWDITVRCMHTQRTGGPGSVPSTYTASALAVLRDKEDSDNWIDARSQRTTATDRVFENQSSCAETLLEEVKILIDAMRKPGSRQ